MIRLPFICISFGFDDFFPILAKFHQINPLVLQKFSFELNEKSSKL